MQSTLTEEEARWTALTPEAVSCSDFSLINDVTASELEEHERKREGRIVYCCRDVGRENLRREGRNE